MIGLCRVKSQRSKINSLGARVNYAPVSKQWVVAALKMLVDLLDPASMVW